MDDLRFLNIIDLGIVPIVIAVCQWVKTKTKIPERWVPVVPFIISFALCSLVIIYTNGGWPGITKFVSGSILETIKVAGASMGAFKLYHTTVKGN